MKDLYSSLDTPSLLVDRTILLRNITGMQDLADRAGVALRPHTKTHRTPAIAAMQVKAGAKGITVAKIGEAEALAEDGVTGILISHMAEPLVSHWLPRLTGLPGSVQGAVR